MRSVFICLLLGLLALLPFLVHRQQFVDWTGKRDVTITLTAKGFEPNVIYITQGTAVTFISEKTEPFWPASDLHPFHLIYPAFDPKRPLDPTESWSFVFDRDGHWGYHDHMESVTTRRDLHEHSKRIAKIDAISGYRSDPVVISNESDNG